MAQLPPDGRFLVQQVDGDVIVFDRDTEEEFYRFNPRRPTTVGPILAKVWEDDRFTGEQRCFIAFWAGYFHAHA